MDISTPQELLDLLAQWEPLDPQELQVRLAVLAFLVQLAQVVPQENQDQ